MAAAQRKTRSRATEDTDRPAQPSWRQPPARSRKRRRRNLATTTPVPAATAKVRAAGDRTQRPLSVTRADARRILAILFTAGVAAGLLLLLRVPYFRVSATSTQIGGAERLDAGRLYEVSSLEGQSVFLVRPADVAARIRQEPGIASADVHVRLPNQVLIDVREHLPLVAWQGVTTTVWLTAEGIEVPQLGPEPPIHLNDRTGLPLAESRLQWPGVLADVSALHRELPQAAALYYGQLEGLYFRSPEGWTVWLGNGGLVENKVALLKEASKEIMAQGIRPQVIDLRFGDREAFWW